jgi:23S rRNA (uracil1939-C5)-methyltransferase
MGRSKKPLPLLEGVTIEAVAAEGKCLFHWNDLVVFVPFCVPGDVCDVQIRRKKHSFAEGEVVRFVEQSKVRAVPFCEHFGVCGGCKWQNLPYEEQLKFKQQQVYDQLHRIGKVELPEFRPILGSVKTQEYRNKLDFGCANKRWLTSEQLADETVQKNTPAIGFHITGAFDKILPIEKCWLMDNLHNQIRNEVRDYAIAHGLSFFDLRQQVGLLRDLIIRNSASGEWLVIFQFHYDHSSADTLAQSEQQAHDLLQHVADRFPQITSLMYLDNQKCNDTIGDQDILTFKGNDHIYELMEDLKFKVGPKSFYQTNTEQAYHLYSVAREFAFGSSPSGKSGELLVYDLYTGTGTIANFVARQARQVIGIEYVPEAIEDAKVNSEINHIDNTLFYAGDMKDILTDEFIEEHGRPDVIITDPPRAGMHPDVVKTILRAAPSRIVYVSCNPATQARDLHDLDEAYKVVEVQPVDMFPHTPHVENVVLLVRR